MSDFDDLVKRKQTEMSDAARQVRENEAARVRWVKSQMPIAKARLRQIGMKAFAALRAASVPISFRYSEPKYRGILNKLELFQPEQKYYNLTSVEIWGEGYLLAPGMTNARPKEKPVDYEHLFDEMLFNVLSGAYVYWGYGLTKVSWVDSDFVAEWSTGSYDDVEYFRGKFVEYLANKVADTISQKGLHR
ncbi:hypothetical protein E7Z53_18215 [Kocuria salina]|uniref:hypothetical protein n=1 Tax=Kocuria salina TaxID=1929416 RepID=UPI001593C007|nr:hypothetical protein [Kocuria salina]NVC25354.1 hypothetical protein [Kocuria salina]